MVCFMRWGEPSPKPQAWFATCRLVLSQLCAIILFGALALIGVFSYFIFIR